MSIFANILNILQDPLQLLDSGLIYKVVDITFIIHHCFVQQLSMLSISFPAFL